MMAPLRLFANSRISLACLLSMGMLILPSVLPNTGYNKAFAGAPVAAGQTVEPYEHFDLFQVVPDNTELTFEEFRKRTSDNFARKFEQIKPISVKRSGSKFVLKTTPTSQTRYGITLHISATVTCDVVKDANGVLTVSNIAGVAIDVGPKRMLLREAIVTPMSGTVVRIDGKIEVSSVLPYIWISKTIDKAKVHKPDEN